MNWKKLWPAVLGLVVLASTWFVKNEGAALGLLTMVLVSVLNLYMQWKGVKMGKFWANLIVVTLSFLMAFLVLVSNPGVQFPPLPDFSDPAAFFGVLVIYLQMVSGLFDRIVSIAFIYYNTLWAKVQEYVATDILKLPTK